MRRSRPARRTACPAAAANRCRRGSAPRSRTDEASLQDRGALRIRQGTAASARDHLHWHFRATFALRIQWTDPCFPAPPDSDLRGRCAPRRTERVHDDAGRRHARRRRKLPGRDREPDPDRSGPAHGRCAPPGRVPSVHTGQTRHDRARRLDGRRLYVAVARARGRTGWDVVGAGATARRDGDQTIERQPASQFPPRRAFVREPGSRAGAAA